MYEDWMKNTPIFGDVKNESLLSEILESDKDHKDSDKTKSNKKST